MAKTDNKTWPELPLEKWRDTCDTLHLLTQIAGKIRLGLAPAEPQWGHAGLFINSHGITTGPIAYNGHLFEINFDLVNQQIAIITSKNYEIIILLRPMTVAQYYIQILDALDNIGVTVPINPKPQEVLSPILFPKDTIHKSYDPEWISRYWQILRLVNITLHKYRAPYRGKTTPVNFWWGTFDLSVSRFSGKQAAPPQNADLIMRGAMDAEFVETGFWPGDDRFPEPAFYSFTYPQPEKIMESKILPEEAHWDTALKEFIMPYKKIRTADDPEQKILDFCKSTFDAGTKSAGWKI